MVTEEHVRLFINSLNTEEDAAILALERYAREHHVPIVKPETRELLRFLVGLKKPNTILEVGTAIGYSAIMMCKEMSANGRIDTIERNEQRYQQALANVAQFGFDNRIHVHFGDAIEVLKTIKTQYDMVFIDAAKAQYGRFFELCMDNLAKDGILICDNVLQEGNVAQSRYALTRRDHTVHARMRQFLYELKHDERFRVVILPVGDGVALVQNKR